MSSLSDNQVRRLILEILYKKAKENPTSAYINRAKMVDILKIPENQIDFNTFYLRDKVLVKLLTAMGSPWICAEITAFGIDVIENKEEFANQFSFVNAIIQVQGDNYGNIAQAVGESVINFNQQVSEAFNKAYGMIESKDNLTSEQKEEIKENTKLLEKELKKTEPDAGRIQQFWKWLKSNGEWVVPTLTQVVMEGIKIACGV